MISSFNGKPQATVGRIRRRLRLADKRTAAKWEIYFVSDANLQGQHQARLKVKILKE
jgi:hypothetical protein